MSKKEEHKEADKEAEKIITPAELIQEQLAQKTQEAADFKDKYFRSLAEMENTKKRLMHERQELIAYSVNNLVEDMLGPIDSLEGALSFTDNLSQEMKNWATGFKMILNQFKSALENHGIVSFESKGKPFDPTYHEAIEMVATDEFEEGTVIEELMKGYKDDRRVIRVARVKVAQKVSQEE
jgi:molecular chaperone GrpE